MIHISEKDLDSYRNISCGKFGYVYQVDDDTAYKIYIPTLYTSWGGEYKNPALKFSKKKFERLIKAGKTLQYTDVLNDIIFIDNKFAGISLPYYDGGVITSIVNKSYDKKVNVSKQLVRNAKELNDHFIYPMDYKLNNIMLEDGNVKIIDLDDPLTKVDGFSHKNHLKKSTIILGDTIYTIFNEFHAKPYTRAITKQLAKPFPTKTTAISDIDDYIDHKESNIPFLIIDSTSDLHRLKRLLNSHDFRLLYKCSERNYNDFYYQQFIDYFASNGISLYDFLGYDHFIDYYLKDYAPCELYELNGKSFVKKK